MADKTTKQGTGGNTPKPGGNTPKPTGTSQSAKDRSRAASRPVATKSPAKGGKPASSGGKGGNTPRPGGRPASPTKPPTSRSTTFLVWGVVGLVIVIIAVLVIVKATSSPNLSYVPVTPAPAQVVHDVTTIPLSVYNTVGVTSSTAPVNPPTIVKGQKPMTLSGGTPAMLYIGAEYCPYCAAERWAMTAALSRFGTWSGLKVTASSLTDTDAGTNTLSYRDATLTSPYLTFKGVEVQTNIPLAGGGYQALTKPTTAEENIYAAYASKHIQGWQPGTFSYPFANINNLAYVSGPSFDPQVLAGQTWSNIADGLSDPTNPATQAIVTTANYMSASICNATKGQPGSVCTSSGVQAAAKALGISAG